MKLVRVGLAVAPFLVLGAPLAKAQMVVSPNVGERVDAPFFSDGVRLHRRHWHHGPRHHYRVRHVSPYRPRFVVLQSAFPAPQAFGWSICCQ